MDEDRGKNTQTAEVKSQDAKTAVTDADTLIAGASKAEDGTYKWTSPSGRIYQGLTAEKLDELCSKGLDYTKKTQTLAAERKAMEARQAELEGRLDGIKPIADLLASARSDSERNALAKDIETQLREYYERGSASPGGGTDTSTADPRLNEVLREIQTLKASLAAEAEAKELQSIQTAIEAELETGLNGYAWPSAKKRDLTKAVARSMAEHDEKLDLADAVREARKVVLEADKPDSVTKKQSVKTLSGRAGSPGLEEPDAPGRFGPRGTEDRKKWVDYWLNVARTGGEQEE